ncbi:hypothetical protein HDV03_002548 [Kappamyces sp. JEL0829]|nr:hypothetical protein HDV03_002548 [Kappamyces sp. JEL0829]
MLSLFPRARSLAASWSHGKALAARIGPLSGTRHYSQEDDGPVPSPAWQQKQAVAAAASPFDEEAYMENTFFGVAASAFDPSVVQHLSLPINPLDVEVKPDGILYYPEIKYRKRLNDAFGPGGWALVPRGAHTIKNKKLSRRFDTHCYGGM